MKNIRGRSFVTIMIVIAVVALLLRVTIDRVVKINIAQNESNASLTLKLISAALENYAKDSHGVYPESIYALTQTKPAYLDRDYITHSPLRGYNYSCSRLDASGYNCSAIPSKCQFSGNKIYTITSGGLLMSEDCNKKE